MTIAAAIVIAYTSFGGLLADAWTDPVPGIALLIGLGAISYAVVRADGLSALAAVDPTMLRPFGRGSRPILAIAEDWAIPVVGSLVAAEVVARIIAPGRDADLLFRGGTVWTGDPSRPTAEAVAVRGGRIVYVGDASGAEGLVGAGTEVVEIVDGMLPARISDARVVLTVFEGPVVFRRSGGRDAG